MSPLLNSSLVVSQLQRRAEAEKSQLARRMHDELGGLLLAATMDVSMLKDQKPPPDDRVLKRLERISRLLHSAIDTTRDVTEHLRPTLLDNVGLFTALRREMQRLCQRSNLRCIDHFPSVEPKISPAAGITLFRIGQEVLFVAEAQPGVKVVEFHVTVSDTQLWMHMSADAPLVLPREESRSGEAWACTQHRVQGLGGDSRLTARGDGTMALIIEVPLMSIQCPSPAKE